MRTPESDVLVLLDGTVVDGTGAPPHRAHVRIVAGRVESISEERPTLAGARAIDASGCVVCPGFIDIHGHSDLAFVHPESSALLAPFLRQGITTQVVGNCGIGVAPAPVERREILAAFMALIAPPDTHWGWTTFAGYLRTVESTSPPLNFAPLASHGAIRCAVLGGRSGPARGAALEAMIDELQAALAAGAFGLSAGLIYPPGMWADTAELVALCRHVAAADKVFTCHVRGSSELAVDAERELIEIARGSGVRVQHSHHEAFGRPYWERALETLRMEDEARAAGIDVASDVIPYHAVNTSLVAIFPPWALEGGVRALIARLGDRETSARIAREIHTRVPAWPPWEDGWAHNLVRAGGWNNIVILQADSAAHAHWIGRDLATIALSEGRSPFACAAEITIAGGGNVMARYHAISGTAGEDDVLRALVTDPHSAVGIDVILKGEGVPHPGGHGAIPRLLGTYARDRGWLSLSEAVRKVTSIPARRIHLSNRGVLLPGAAADVVVFDSETIAERGTYDDPGLPPEGISYVIVNGVVAVEDDEIIISGAGAVLRG